MEKQNRFLFIRRYMAKGWEMMGNKGPRLGSKGLYVTLWSVCYNSRTSGPLINSQCITEIIKEIILFTS